MSEINTTEFTMLNARDFTPEARFITPVGAIVRPGTDGCWVNDSSGEHIRSVMEVREYKPTEPEPAPVSDEPKTPEQVIREARELIESQVREIDNRDTQIRALRTENERLTNSVETKSRQLQDVRQQVEDIRDNIIAEAKNRGWCDEVNAFLRRCNLDEWEQEYEVTFASFTVTLTVAGCDGEDEVREQAIQEVLNDPSSYLEVDEVNET
jgi:hypothetical protein